MLALNKLKQAQQTNRSHICLGLDLDPKRMPSEYAGTLKGMFEFAHRIIDATSDLVCAYKPNLAFYESHGPEGLALLQLVVERIPDKIPVILDGKRNDIGNTATQYANALFDRYRADWVTINPYMGYDSMRPFLERKDRGVFVLCLTSNSGSKDFQLLNVEGRPLYMVVADRVNYWNKEHNCGLVVGATHPDQLGEVRTAAGEMPILIPGVGAQGGSLELAIAAGTDNFRKPALVNVSRSVLYASNADDFAQRARQELMKLNGVVARLRQGDQEHGDQKMQPTSPQPEAASQPQVDSPPPAQDRPAPAPPVSQGDGPQEQPSPAETDRNSSGQSGQPPPSPPSPGRHQ